MIIHSTPSFTNILDPTFFAANEITRLHFLLCKSLQPHMTIQCIFCLPNVDNIAYGADTEHLPYLESN